MSPSERGPSQPPPPSCSALHASCLQLLPWPFTSFWCFIQNCDLYPECRPPHSRCSVNTDECVQRHIRAERRDSVRIGQHTLRNGNQAMERLIHRGDPHSPAQLAGQGSSEQSRAGFWSGHPAGSRLPRFLLSHRQAPPGSHGPSWRGQGRGRQG